MTHLLIARAGTAADEVDDGDDDFTPAVTPRQASTTAVKTMWGSRFSRAE